VNYRADAQGTQVIYDTVADTVCQMRASAPIQADWSARIQKDFQREE
jgi:hypothetical protein